MAAALGMTVSPVFVKQDHSTSWRRRMKQENNSGAPGNPGSEDPGPGSHVAGSEEDQRRNLTLGHGMGLFVAVTFGSAYPLGKPVVAALDPVVFSCARYLIAGALMLLFLAATGRDPRIAWRDVPVLLGLGFLGYGIFQGFWGIALELTTASKAVVLVATSPIFGALIGAVMGDRLPFLGWLGVLGAFAGVFVVINGSLTQLNIGGGTLVGDGLFVFIAAVWALYGALSRNALVRLGAWRMTGWAALFGSLMLVPFAIP
ncbi:MAG: DMT family transporter, partial [Pirellulales bacterium]|nr:DMT family transporter [Pirellulales bacterium]